VREAIKSLESLQLISVRPKIGAVVLEPSPVALINAEYLSTSAFMQQADSLIEFRKVLVGAGRFGCGEVHGGRLGRHAGSLG